MSSVLYRLLDVMRLRAGPQEMPQGWAAAIFFSLIYLSQGLFADQALGESDSIRRAFVAISVQFGVTSVLLGFRQLRARLPQTLSALAGTGVLFAIISLLLIMQAKPGVDQPALALLWLGVFFWSLTVDAHIYRSALSITMSVGMLIAVVIFGINFLVLEFLFFK